MKNYLILLCLSLYLFFYSGFTTVHAQTANAKAVNYNDYIVDEQNKIGEAILNFDKSFENDEVDEENANLQYNTLVNQIGASIIVLEGLDSYDGNVELRNSALDLFRFYDRIVKNQYKELLGLFLKSDFTSDDENRTNELIGSISEEELIYDQKFEKAQVEFAEKYNIELKKNELQEEFEDD